MPQDAGGGPPNGGQSGGRIVVYVDADVRELTDQYLEGRGEDVRALRDEVAAGDYTSIWRRGHNMKGDGTAFGFDYISELGAALEVAAERQDAAGVLRAADALAAYLPRLDVRERADAG